MFQSLDDHMALGIETVKDGDVSECAAGPAIARPVRSTILLPPCGYRDLDVVANVSPRAHLLHEETVLANYVAFGIERHSCCSESSCDAASGAPPKLLIHRRRVSFS